jgi:hypothetical protein
MRPLNRSSVFASAQRSQRGQALIFGLFVLISGLAALFFFFNVGQLSREKTKLVNTADAVAYSAGVMQARALNFTAYGNRALVANEVLIAQMVSVSSWAQYIGDWTDNVQRVHPVCAAMAQAANGNWAAAGLGGLAATTRFDGRYALACAALSNETFAEATRQLTDAIPSVAEAVVSAAEINKRAISTAQDILHSTAGSFGVAVTRQQLMQNVADANYVGEGRVTVSPFDLGVADDWFRGGNGRGFVRQYADNERTRFREVTVNAANTDPFVQQRSWTSTAPMPEPSCLPFHLRFNRVERKGGTELLGFDQWHAVDTQSYHNNFRGKRWWNCNRRETITAASEQEAYRDQQWSGGASFGGSRAVNPRAHRSALNAGTQDFGYSGLPSYYDLNEVWISGANRTVEPTMRHAVRLSRTRAELRTTDGGNGQIRTQTGSRIGAYNSSMAADEMDAISTAEVYFERPPGSPSRGSGVTELGSLFNPYWQVRLVNSDAAVAAVIARKGVAN